MSYTIDIYRKLLNPTKDFISFASFVSFFPQLVAGPIERSVNLLPQILRKREFKYEQGVQGLRLIIWGMFKKVVIADSLAPMVNDIFGNYQDFGGGTLWLGLVYFSFQIYCDFSGYSDIAIGTSKLFGIELMSNFNFPFFSRNISEFWRRWHISMTSWFTDYLYYPLRLKYRDSGYLTNILVLLLYFIIIGLWHGDNWTFIAFGLYHGVFFTPTIIFPKFYKLKTKQISLNKFYPSIKELFQVGTTFIFITVGWIFFRSETLEDSFLYLYKILFEFNISGFKINGMLYIIPFIILDYLIRKDERNILFAKNKLANKSLFILFVISIVLMFFKETSADFIYFQF